MQPVSPPPGKFALAWDGTGTAQLITGREVHYRLARGQRNNPVSVGSLIERKNLSMAALWKGCKVIPSENGKGIWDQQITNYRVQRKQLESKILSVCLSLQLLRATNQSIWPLVSVSAMDSAAGAFTVMPQSYGPQGFLCAHAAQQHRCWHQRLKVWAIRFSQHALTLGELDFR